MTRRHRADTLRHLHTIFVRAKKNRGQRPRQSRWIIRVAAPGNPVGIGCGVEPRVLPFDRDLRRSCTSGIPSGNASILQERRKSRSLVSGPGGEVPALPGSLAPFLAFTTRPWKNDHPWPFPCSLVPWLHHSTKYNHPWWSIAALPWPPLSQRYCASF